MRRSPSQLPASLSRRTLKKKYVSSCIVHSFIRRPPPPLSYLSRALLLCDKIATSQQRRTARLEEVQVNEGALKEPSIMLLLLLLPSILC